MPNGKLFRSLGTLQEFDDGSSHAQHSLGRSMSVPGSERQLAVPSETQDHFFIVALLEHLCSIYMPDAQRSRLLFKVICGQLVKNGIMTALHAMDEVSSIRALNQRRFSSIVHAAMTVICQADSVPLVRRSTLQDRALILLHPIIPRAFTDFSTPNHNRLQTSRYREEFCDINKIGCGAYGSVYKAHHKLDGCDYAIKKIFFHEMNTESFFKILREAKYLAGLNHRNIVRYHGAWMEMEFPVIPEVEGEGVTFDINSRNLPALKYTPQPGSKCRQGVEDSESVVFAEDNNSKAQAQSQSESRDESFSQSAIIHHRTAKKPVFVLHIQMELCHETLKDWLSARNANVCKDDVYMIVDEALLRRLLKQILRSVEYIHIQGIMHRDIKPKNIFLTQNLCGGSECKLGDFGLARFLDDDPMTPSPGETASAFDVREGSELFTSGIGTTIYAAPEQLQGANYNTKADMFSMGLVLFELYQPFRTEMERYKTLTQLRKGHFPTEFKQRWPVQASFIEGLLSPVPEDRPSANTLLHSQLVLSKDQVIASQQSQINEQQSKLTQLNTVVRTKNDEIENLKAEIEKLQTRLIEKGTAFNGRLRHRST